DFPAGQTTIDVTGIATGSSTLTAFYVTPVVPIHTRPNVTVPGGNAQGYTLGASRIFHLGSFTDPDDGPWTAQVDWGDGSALQTVATVNGTSQTTPFALPDTNHTYPTGGADSYDIT